MELRASLNVKMLDHSADQIALRGSEVSGIRVMFRLNQGGRIQNCPDDRWRSMEILDERTHHNFVSGSKLSSDRPPNESGDCESHLAFEHAGPSMGSRARSLVVHGSRASLTHGLSVDSRQDRTAASPTGSSFAAFVERKFIPEYVATKKAAGRAHFRAILKHVLPPESVDAAFGISTPERGRTLKAVPRWPYLTSINLSEITVEAVQHLALTALQQGYSLQTATHIRNVIRNVYTYATQIGYHCGENPAAGVILPPLSRKNEQVLTLAELKQLTAVMPSPARELMLFTVLTEMSVVEICGLQWMYFNTTSSAKWADGEFIPPNTIAVRNQYYRGEFSPVTGSRRRFIRVADRICLLGTELRKSRKQSVSPQDFVLAARNGSPINPENIAMRHLKSIGNSVQIPGLSWGSFQRTRSALRTKFGKNWPRETEKAIFS